MSGWEIAAWVIVTGITVFRVAFLIGFLALTVAIVRRVRALEPAPQPE